MKHIAILIDWYGPYGSVKEANKAAKESFEAGQSLPRSYFVAKHSSFFHWPLENRPKDSKNRNGSLHVKCAVGDKRSILLSSAYLTGHAFNLNMEMGVLIHNDALSAKPHSHFKDLIRKAKILLR